MGNVWLIENNSYIEFGLIEKRYLDETLDEVESMKQKQKRLVDKVILKGRLTQNPYVKYTETEPVCITRFTLACGDWERSREQICLRAKRFLSVGKCNLAVTKIKKVRKFILWSVL